MAKKNSNKSKTVTFNNKINKKNNIKDEPSDDEDVNFLEDKEKLKKIIGGLKSVDDAEQVDDDDYSTDNGDDDEVEEKEEIEKEVNSDDDLENKDEDDDDNEEEEEDEEDEEDEEEEEEEDEVEETGEDGDVDCVYRFSGKKKVKDTLELRTEDTFFEEDNKKVSKFVSNDKRITKKFMTLFERVRLLGERAKQLSLGAKPMIKNVENLEPKEIAKLELEQKVIPLIIIRTLPNGQKEKWRVDELTIVS